MRAGESARAREHHRACAPFFADDPHYWWSLGVLCCRSQQPDDAVAAFQQAVLLRPALAEAWLNMGLVFASQGDTARALQIYQAALMKCPEHPDLKSRVVVLTTGGPGAPLAGQQPLDIDDAALITPVPEEIAARYLGAVPELPAQCFGLGELGENFKLMASWPQSIFL
jgi:tetratricopeptide (TPR) repeat protein